jgi:dipeptidase D
MPQSFHTHPVIMTIFKKSEPALLWHYFEEICRIPRPSKKEDKIIEFLSDFAEKHGLDWKKDDAGNVLITKQATSGYENRKTTVLQSHLDMVCEKNSNTDHNFETDPILPYIDGDWVRARETTLGADDGIGVAAQLALLASDDLQHGRIECLFTVDEETGLSGAFALQPGFFEGSILINLDSEDEGELFVGCAGGIDTVATLEFKNEDIPALHKGYIASVGGLKGGHSGDDIHKGRGNSIKILNRFLWNVNKRFDMRLVYFNGGNLRNAIPREARALFSVHPDDTAGVKGYFDSFQAMVSRELSFTDDGFHISMDRADLPSHSIDQETSNGLLHCLYACPNGAMSWNHRISNMVESSSNLATIRAGNNKIQITTSQRSSADSIKADISDMIESVFRLANANIRKTGAYPGWEPDYDSQLLKICESAYKKLFHNTPVVRTIHAGLECGLFLEKYPGLDMISFGPTILGAHSPDERLHIGSVGKFWDLLKEVLKNIPGRAKN